MQENGKRVYMKDAPAGYNEKAKLFKEQSNADDIGFLGKKTQRLENLSAYNEGTARDLAKFGTYWANKGECGGLRLISEETWNTMHSEPDQTAEAMHGLRTTAVKGGPFLSHDLNGFTAEKGPYYH